MTLRKYVTDTLMTDGQSLTQETSFMARNILDSTGVAELTVFLEDTFGIEISDQDIVPENLDSLGAIEAFVKRKLSAVSP